VILLAFAITLLERFWAGPLTLGLWALLSIISGVYLGALNMKTTKPGWPRLWQGLGLVLIFYGVIALIGAMMGHSDPIRPLAVAENKSSAIETGTHVRVTTRAELENQIHQASLQNQPVILDYYADWCVSCVIMEKTTFKDSNVMNLSAPMRWITVDVTANNAETRSMQDLFQVYAPPTLVFLDADGREKTELRQVGEIRAKTLVGLLGRM
jgi:thiol:disulfide interchange protein DsbD